MPTPHTSAMPFVKALCSFSNGTPVLERAEMSKPGEVNQYINKGNKARTRGNNWTRARLCALLVE